MDEINKIAEDLKTETNPIILVDYLTKLAAYAAYYEGLLQPIQMLKPEKWIEIKCKKRGDFFGGSGPEFFKQPTDKQIDMIWAATKEGQEEIKYTSELKKIALMTSAIKQNLWAKKIEYRNLNPNI